VTENGKPFTVTVGPDARQDHAAKAPATAARAPVAGV